jgi:hypothetical protein
MASHIFTDPFSKDAVGIPLMRGRRAAFMLGHWRQGNDGILYPARAYFLRVWNLLKCYDYR